MGITDIATGWSVYSAEGQRVGEVREIGQDAVIVGRDFLTADTTVPTSSVNRVEDHRVYLGLAADSLERLARGEPLEVVAAAGSSAGSVSARDFVVTDEGRPIDAADLSESDAVIEESRLPRPLL